MKLKGIWNYSQPDFYHFSEDSTFLASYAIDFLKENKENLTRGLDLCAGCGVVGLEILSSINTFEAFDFCELQDGFLKHLKENCRHFDEVKINIIKSRFQSLNCKHKYDLIVCNPPYFDPGSSRLPDKAEKMLCRFMDKSDWIDLLRFMEKSLTKEGSAFFLQRIDLFNKIEFDKTHVSLQTKKGEVGLFRISPLHIN